MNQRRHLADKKRRQGFSVAEVLIAATGVSVLSVLSITLICLLMTAEQRTMESIVIERTISELAHELRQDAHLASTVALSDDQLTLTLQLADNASVTYSCSVDAVSRSNASGHGEAFSLPFGESKFSLSDSEQLITFRHERQPAQDMSLSESPTAAEESGHIYRIDAALSVGNRDTGSQP